MGRVEGKTALVTGGASGIGRASAQILAREGAAVMVADVNDAGGEETAKAIGDGARYIHLDVSDEAGWKAAVAETVEDFGGLDILVNCAGFGGTGAPQDPEHAELEEWRKINAINLEGVFLGCKHAIAAMAASGGGSIVNISSLASMVATPLIAAYGASKAGVCQLTKSVALYCARQGNGIRCNSVHPGIIETPMTDALFTWSKNDAETYKKRALATVPLGRFGEPSDVGHMVLFLASDEARFVTGAEFVVDGGMSIY